MAELSVIENRRPVPSDLSALLTPLRFDGRTTNVPERSAAGRGGFTRLAWRAGMGLTRDERRVLMHDRDRLAELLEPAMPIERGAEIVRLLASMPSADLGEAEALRQDAYQEALQGAPLFAIEAARRAFFRGEAAVAGRALDPRYAPAPPELAILVRQQAYPYRLQLARIAALLAAPEEPPAPGPEEEARRQRHADETLRRCGFVVDTAAPSGVLEGEARSSTPGPTAGVTQA